MLWKWKIIRKSRLEEIERRQTNIEKFILDVCSDLAIAIKQSDGASRAFNKLTEVQLIEDYSVAGQYNINTLQALMRSLM